MFESQYTSKAPALVPSKKTPIIAEMQERVDDIQTEAARLMVFANTTTDLALAGKLKGIAKAVFKNATEIERQLTKLRRAK